MMNDPIYLDHNATTPLLPEVADAMLPYLREHFGNPSSGHVYGARARDAVAHAREQMSSRSAITGTLASWLGVRSRPSLRATSRPSQYPLRTGRSPRPARAFPRKNAA
jgi:hypothetical protein